MLETIEIEIDTNGYIRPIEPTVRLSAGRALLTLLKDNQTTSKPSTQHVFEDLFGILTAPPGATLEKMESVILQHAQERFNDSALFCNQPHVKPHRSAKI